MYLLSQSCVLISVHSKKKRHLLHMSCDFQRRREIEEIYSSDKYSERYVYSTVYVLNK